MRILGLDYGSNTVGVAVSDELGWTAQALETISRKDENKLRKTLARIEELVKIYNVERIVLGYPKHMNNDVGERCAKTESFKEMLERRTGLPVILQDERLSTSLQNGFLWRAESAGRTARIMWTRWRLPLFCRHIWIGWPMNRKIR